MSETDRRMYQRVSFDGNAELSSGEQTFGCQVTDLSLKGVLIRPFGVIRADIGAVFSLKIPLLEDNHDNPISIVMQLELAHSSPDGLGFRCISIDLDSITHLRQIVELNSHEPDLLERDLESLVTE
jgi:PilZ domain